MDLLPNIATGDLRHTSVPELMAAAFRSSATGALVISHDGGESRIYLRYGSVCGVVLHTETQSLAELLVSLGILDGETHERTRTRALREKRQHGEILIEEGVLSSERLQDFLVLQHCRNLALISAVRRGAYELRGWERPPSWTETVSIDPLRAVLSGLETDEFASRRRELVSIYRKLPLTPASDLDSLRARLVFEPEEAEALRGALSTRRYFEFDGLPPSRAEALSCALVLLGMLEAPSDLTQPLPDELPTGEHTPAPEHTGPLTGDFTEAQDPAIPERLAAIEREILSDIDEVIAGMGDFAEEPLQLANPPTLRTPSPHDDALALQVALEDAISPLPDPQSARIVDDLLPFDAADLEYESSDREPLVLDSGPAQHSLAAPFGTEADYEPPPFDSVPFEFDFEDEPSQEQEAAFPLPGPEAMASGGGLELDFSDLGLDASGEDLELDLGDRSGAPLAFADHRNAGPDLMLDHEDVVEADVFDLAEDSGAATRFEPSEHRDPVPADQTPPGPPRVEEPAVAVYREISAPPPDRTPIESPAAAQKPPERSPRQREDPAAVRRRMLNRAMRAVGGKAFSGDQSSAGVGRIAPPLTPERLETTGDPLAKEVAERLSRLAQETHFERLGLPPSATTDQVKAAFLGLAKRFHPDRLTAAGQLVLLPSVRELFSAIKDSYDVLVDSVSRERYLAELSVEKEKKKAVETFSPEEVHAIMARVEHHVRRNDLRRAEQELRRLAAADPRPRHLAELAWVLLNNPTRRSEAITEVRDLAARALAGRPESDRAYSLAAQLAQLDGQDDRFERYARRALELNPRNVEAARELRLFQMRRQRLQDQKGSGILGRLFGK